MSQSRQPDGSAVADLLRGFGVQVVRILQLAGEQKSGTPDLGVQRPRCPVPPGLQVQRELLRVGVEELAAQPLG